MHPRSIRSARSAITSLGCSVDLGIVRLPNAGEMRGRGFWMKRDLDVDDVERLLPRAAAENAAGAAIYMRVRLDAEGGHPAIVLVDDLDAAAVARLVADGLEPLLVVETSPRNHQAWVRLADAPITPALAHRAARYLAETYGGDLRAVASTQPGRLPGFTNRKEVYRSPQGLFPFVKIAQARDRHLATQGSALLAHLGSGADPAQGARGARAEKPEPAIRRATPAISFDRDLQELHAAASRRITDEVAAGRRPAVRGTLSEIDYALALSALRRGVDPDRIASWIARHRPEKHEGYSGRTVEAARTFIATTAIRPKS